MIEALKEIFYRLKVKSYDKKIIESNKKREGLKLKQRHQTLKYEQYKAKLESIK